MSPTEHLSMELEHATTCVSSESLADARARVVSAHRDLVARQGLGREFLGWLDLPERMSAPALGELVARVSALRDRTDALVVIGIGGSSLGARAALNALGRGAEEFPVPGEAHPVVFAGHHLSSDATLDALQALESVDFGINVISKSGTTTEPGIAFRIFRDQLETRHGARWPERVIATTDAESGALRAFAGEHALTTFEVPRDVGGRFSVLSPVGLVPLVYAGVNVDDLLAGAREMRARLLEDSSAESNPAMAMAAVRHALYRDGFTVDVLSITSPRLRRLGQWWQQLFGESEGKDGRGPFPALCEIPGDLHSLGQYLQDGHRQVYETFLHVRAAERELSVPAGDARDGLDYLTGRTLTDVVDAATGGTRDAHAAGGVPTLRIDLPRLDAHTLGQTVFFFEVVVALGGALLGVNPFDQPGVEAYKSNMFERLGRP